MAQSRNTRKEFGTVEIVDEMVLSDSAPLHLGTSGTDGFDISFDGTNTLNIDALVANDTVRIGETTQADLQVDGATDLLWDASAGSLANGGFLGLFMPDAAITNVAAGGGAISITNPFTTINTDGSVDDAFTLADGTVIGQIKGIALVTDGGVSAIITPTTFADGTTLTFADANDFCILVWGASGWRTLMNVGGSIA